MRETNRKSVDKSGNKMGIFLGTIYPHNYRLPNQQVINRVIHDALVVRGVTTDEKKCFGTILGDFNFRAGAFEACRGEKRRANPWPEVACNEVGLAVRDCWFAGWDDANNYLERNLRPSERK